MIRIWYLADNICGKRLAPAMEAIVTNLENNNEMSFTDEVRDKLLAMGIEVRDTADGVVWTRV